MRKCLAGLVVVVAVFGAEACKKSGVEPAPPEKRGPSDTGGAGDRIQGIPAGGGVPTDAGSGPPPPTVVEAQPAGQGTGGPAAGSAEAGTVTGTPVEAGATTAVAAPQTVVSTDLLARAPVCAAAQVKHILIGFMEAEGASRLGERAMARTQAEAGRLALDLLERVRNGERMERLMADYSEDPGSAQSGEPYAVNPNAELVQPFIDLSLRLNVGEAGIVESSYGYHIIKRVE